MVIYSVEVFDKQSEELVLEVEIPKSKLKGVAAIMGWGRMTKRHLSKASQGSMLAKHRHWI